MIKILFFLERLCGGGAEKVLCNLVNHMDPDQFDITVQTLWPYKRDGVLAPQIKYRSVYPVRNSLTEKLYRLEAASGLLYRLHIKDSFDIECAFLEAGPTKVIAASTNKKAKKIAWVHCDLKKAIDDPERFVRKSLPWYEQFDGIACVSKDVKDSFDDLFGGRFTTTVVYNVIDTEAILQKSKERLPDDIQKRRFTVVSVGRLEYQKGYDVLLKVYKRLRDEGHEFDLWIAGEGAEQAALEQYISENDLQGVRLLGFRDNPYSIMAAADYLVCSSRWEGFSTFATEGIVLGKPLVTTDCTGMQELLGDSQYGLIVENEENALYQGMKRMMVDAELRLQYSLAAKSKAEDLSIETLTRKTVSYLTTGVNYEH